MELKEIFDKVRHSFNNSAEAWNKGLTVDYTILTTDQGNITYQWENIVSQDEVHLPCKLKDKEDVETQIRQTLNTIKGLIQYT